MFINTEILIQYLRKNLYSLLNFHNYTSPLLFLLLILSLFPYDTKASDDAKRLLSLVDYIGGDYKNAVSDGKIISIEEFDEMSEFSNEAITLIGYINPKNKASQIRDNLIQLESKIKGKAPVEEVENLTKKIKEGIISAYGLVPYPNENPSVSNGSALYEKKCSNCHGLNGSGDGTLSPTLNPPPTNFVDKNSIASLSPFKVFNTMSFGIKGTGMPAFSQLPDNEKWDVAFYVLSLGYKDNNPKDGGGLSGLNYPRELDDYKTLAMLSNDELIEKIGASNANEKDIPIIISNLRSGSIQTKGNNDISLTETNSILKRAIDLYKEGRIKEAYQTALDSYLDGFERVEPVLILKDRNLTYQIEGMFSELRSALKQEKPVEDVEEIYNEISDELNRASLILSNGKPVGQLISFTNSLSIIVREGLEAVLIVAAVISFLAAAGMRSAIRYVHIGWSLALGAGFITWFLAKTIISISGAQREIIEGVTALTAAVVLFYVSYWLITKIEVKKWQVYIKGKVQKAISRKSLFALSSVSFFAVYREAFETVLFYQALWYQAENSKGAIIWGLVIGTALLMALVLVIFKLAVRVPLNYFFSITSFFLYLLSFIFIGKGIRELQEAGVIGITQINLIPQIDFLGIYPTLETSLLQGVLIIAFVGALFWVGYVKKEKEKKEIVISVSRISEDMKSMHESFEHIKQHIIEWKRCEEIDIEAEELDNQIQGVITHVDELESKLTDFYDVVTKNSETLSKPETVKQNPD